MLVLDFLFQFWDRTVIVGEGNRGFKSALTLLSSKIIFFLLLRDMPNLMKLWSIRHVLTG